MIEECLCVSSLRTRRICCCPSVIVRKLKHVLYLFLFELKTLVTHVHFEALRIDLVRTECVEEIEGPQDFLHLFLRQMFLLLASSAETMTMTMTHSHEVANVNQKPALTDMGAGVMICTPCSTGKEDSWYSNQDGVQSQKDHQAFAVTNSIQRGTHVDTRVFQEKRKT